MLLVFEKHKSVVAEGIYLSQEAACTSILHLGVLATDLPSTATNVACSLQVEQMSCVVPHHEIMMYLSVVIKTHMQQDPQFKVGCAAV